MNAAALLKREFTEMSGRDGRERTTPPATAWHLADRIGGDLSHPEKDVAEVSPGIGNTWRVMLWMLKTCAHHHYLQTSQLDSQITSRLLGHGGDSNEATVLLRARRDSKNDFDIVGDSTARGHNRKEFQSC